MLVACICRTNKTVKSLTFQSKIRWLGITVRRSPIRVLHCTALFTFYLRSRRTCSLPGSLTRFYLQDKGSWSGSYCTMIHPAPNIHEAAEDMKQLRPLCQINKLGNSKATGCFTAIFGPIFLKPSGWVLFCLFFFLVLQLFVSFFGLFKCSIVWEKKAARAEILYYYNWREHCWQQNFRLLSVLMKSKVFGEIVWSTNKPDEKIVNYIHDT